MKVKLHIEKGRKPAQTVILRGPEAVIGRATGNTVRVPSSDVSRKHCRISIRDQKVTLEDLGSLNGTYLNSKRVEGVRPIRPGDRIRLGPVTFIVEFVPDSSYRGQLDELELVEAGEIHVPLSEGEAVPASKSEAPTTKRKPLAGSDAPDKENQTPKPKPENALTDEDIALAHLADLSPGRTLDEDDLVRLAGEHPREKSPEKHVEFDQAWKVTEPASPRDGRHGAELHKAIEKNKEET